MIFKDFYESSISIENITCHELIYDIKFIHLYIKFLRFILNMGSYHILQHDVIY